MEKRRIILICLSVIFLGVAVYSGVQVIIGLKDYKKGEEAYNELNQYVQIEAPTPSVPETDKKEEDKQEEDSRQNSEAEPEESWPVVDFEALHKICPDVIGWIYVKDTGINYPMVQSEDNNYYLRRLIDGTNNKSGTIFMDYRNDPEFKNRHTIIYGHNMRNDTMFAHITKYKDQSYYEQHPYCLIVTPTEKYKINFFSGYVANLKEDSWKLSFGSEEEYAEWLRVAVEKSNFKSDFEPTVEDKVVTLSTCSYEFTNARYVLVGVIEKIS